MRSKPFLPQIDGLKLAFLLWMPLAPITAIGSGILSARIVAHIVAGIDYYPSQDPSTEGGWLAMMYSVPALLCFIFFLPTRFARILEPVERGRVALFLIGGHIIILLSAAALALITVFWHGIPEGIQN